MLVDRYSPETEQQMKSLYKSLNERDCRRYAAIEADKLGYGGATYISELLGGSNSARRLTFKEQLERVADWGDMIITVAHYPPGCSKYNPIEYRLFPHVTRKLQGLFLKSMEMVRDLSRRATTTSGLHVFARTLRGLYEIGHRATVNSLEQLHLLLDPILPRWNYTILPKPLREVI